jgi:hypothetical protein
MLGMRSAQLFRSFRVTKRCLFMAMKACVFEDQRGAIYMFLRMENSVNMKCDCGVWRITWAMFRNLYESWFVVFHTNLCTTLIHVKQFTEMRIATNALLLHVHISTKVSSIMMYHHLKSMKFVVSLLRIRILIPRTTLHSRVDWAQIKRDVIKLYLLKLPLNV